LKRSKKTNVIYPQTRKNQSASKTMNRLLRILILTFLALSPCYSFGAVVTYSFTGGVPAAFGGGSLWGFSVANGTPVSGTFKYDTSTVASSTSGNLSIYPQSFTGGFTGNFGSIPIIANDYTIHVLNDQPQPPSGTPKDVVTIEWASNDNPVPPTPLNANGTTQSTGLYQISFFYPSTTFPDMSLPPSLPTSGFDTILPDGSLSSSTTKVDVLFTLSTLTAVPEPAAWAISLSGALSLALARYRIGRRQ
jgi:hypothetical protein